MINATSKVSIVYDAKPPPQSTIEEVVALNRELSVRVSATDASLIRVQFKGPDDGDFQTEQQADQSRELLTSGWRGFPTG